MTMKDQPAAPNIRTYDNDGYRKRAAAVCVKDEKGDEVLLVTSKRVGASKWVVPGGGVEPDERAADAAEREVFEEAGVKGSIVRQLGVFENAECKHRTSVFLFRVVEECHDWDDARRIGRKRRWFPVLEARRLLGMYKQCQQAYLDTITELRSSPATSSSSSNSSSSSSSDKALTTTNEHPLVAPLASPDHVLPPAADDDHKIPPPLTTEDKNNDGVVTALSLDKTAAGAIDSPSSPTITNNLIGSSCSS